jgi:hypothetical protein
VPMHCAGACGRCLDAAKLDIVHEHIRTNKHVPAPQHVRRSLDS